MKGYDFLEKHPNFHMKGDLSNNRYYVFHKKTEKGTVKGTIQVPITEEGTFDWYFSSDETENWFDVLLKEAEQKSSILFRLKKVVNGKNQ